MAAASYLEWASATPLSARMQLECRCCPQIPNPLLRWALPKLLDILYPLFLRLNERFEETPFAPRWACVRACACCVCVHVCATC